MSCAPKEPSDAPPQKPLSRACAHHFRHPTQADQGGAGLSPCTGRPCGGRGATCLRRLRHLPLGEFCPAEMGAALCAGGAPGLTGSPALRATAQGHVRAGAAPQSPRRSRPPPAWRPLVPVELPRTGDCLSPRNRRPTRPRKRALCVKKNTVSYCRPTGRLDPTPADLAYGSLELAALEYRARRGDIILLYEDETVLWRFALPRLGWWRRAQRYRLPTRPLSQSQIRREESLKRQGWGRYRSWSRIASGVLLSVIGAVQYGTTKVFYKIVPHFDAQEFRQYIHQVMATFSRTGKEVVMVVDRSGIHRAHKLDATLEHYHNKFRFHFLPAHCGHHLNPIEGFWRVMKDAIGAGRCWRDLPTLYQRTRHVLMAHQERPIYEFHW